MFNRVRPILEAHGAPVDYSTVECGGSENVMVIDRNGKITSEVGGVTLRIPAFDELRKQGLQALVDELAAALGIPVSTQDAAIKAGFPPPKS